MDLIDKEDGLLSVHTISIFGLGHCLFHVFFAGGGGIHLDKTGAGGFQGQRQWTDWKPNGDFTEALLNTTFDWNGPREPMILATENDSLNGTAMLLAHVLTNLPQIFSDVRTYWSPEAVKRVTGKELTGTAAPGIIHLINSGATTLDGTGQSKDKDGNPDYFGGIIIVK